MYVMYVGSPVTFEVAVSFIEGIGWALAVAPGDPPPISRFAELLHPLTSCEAVPDDQDYEAIQTLFPALKALFTAAVVHIRRKPSAPPAGHDG